MNKIKEEMQASVQPMVQQVADGGGWAWNNDDNTDYLDASCWDVHGVSVELGDDVNAVNVVIPWNELQVIADRLNLQLQMARMAGLI